MLESELDNETEPSTRGHLMEIIGGLPRTSVCFSCCCCIVPAGEGVDTQGSLSAKSSEVDMQEDQNAYDREAVPYDQDSDDDAYINPAEVQEIYDLGDDDEAPMDDDEDDMEDEDEGTEGDTVDDASQIFTSHSDSVYTVAINPVNVSMIATGGGDDKAFISNLENGQRVFELSGHTDSVVKTAFNAAGTLLATAGLEGTIRIWDVTTGQLCRCLEGPSEDIEWISWHPKGDVIAAGSADATIWMWLASTGACMQVFAGHEGPVSCGSFTTTGMAVVSGSMDGSVKLWNPKTGQCKHTFSGGEWHEGPIMTLCCHPTLPMALTGSQDGTARVIHLQSKRVLGVLEHNRGHTARVANEEGREMELEASDSSVEAVGFSSTVNWCATGSMDGEVRIWDLNTFACRHICRHDSSVVAVKWHPLQPVVVSCSADGSVRVWDARSGACLKRFQGHRDMVLDIDLAVLPSGQLAIVTASDDHTSRLFIFSQ